METVTSKIKFKRNPYIVDIIMKYELYQQIKIKPVFAKSIYGSSYPIPNCFESFEINARITKEDFDKIATGHFVDNITINGLKIPHVCSIITYSYNHSMNYYEINLSFLT